MQKSKIGLDFEKVEHARSVARKIADQVQDFVGNYTTVAVERTICRLLGIDGIDENEVPLPNVVVDELKSKGVLGQGVAYFLGNAIIETGKTPQQIAEDIVAGKLDLTQLSMHKVEETVKAIQRECYACTQQPSASRELHQDNRRGLETVSLHHCCYG